MGCFGDREKGPPEQSQRWEYLTLSDFKNTSAWNVVAYIWLWIMGLVSVAVYAADTFTAVNLLAFDKWSSQIKPALDMKYSKWIFAVCILLSWALCFYEWFRALRVIRRGGVAESYMDPLAVSLQSMRPQGWKRFLVFSELTKSKKGADYVALFVYFAFKGAIRIIVAEGPRVFVNGMTLYSVADADLIVHGKPTGSHSSFEQFWLNFGQLAENNTEQTVILCAMLFTATIWVFSALQLLAAIVLYITFLWHYIPQQDGRLSVYCRRKVDRRLEKVVEVKVKAAIEDEERAKQKAELKRVKTGEKPPGPIRQPTLPQMGISPDLSKDDTAPEFALKRQDTSMTMTTLPPYSSRPPTRNDSQAPTLPSFRSDRPGMPSRSGTQTSGWSTTSYDSNAPLLDNAGYAGDYSRTGSPAPHMPAPAYSRQGSNGSNGRPAPSRAGTQSSQNSTFSYNHPIPGRSITPGSQRSRTPMTRMDTQFSQRTFSPLSQGHNAPGVQSGYSAPMRSHTGLSFDRTTSPANMTHEYDYDHDQRPMPPPVRQNTADTFRTAPVRQDSQTSLGRPAPTLSRQQTFGSLHSHQSSFSRPMPARRPTNQSFSRPISPPALQESPGSYEMTARPVYADPVARSQTPASSGGFVAFNPAIYESAVPNSGPQRSVTVQDGPSTQGGYFGHIDPVQRSGTAPAPAPRPTTTGYGDILDGYASDEAVHAHGLDTGRPAMPSEPIYRPHTTGPPGGYTPYR